MGPRFRSISVVLILLLIRFATALKRSTRAVAGGDIDSNSNAFPGYEALNFDLEQDDQEQQRGLDAFAKEEEVGVYDEAFELDRGRGNDWDQQRVSDPLPSDSDELDYVSVTGSDSDLVDLKQEGGDRRQESAHDFEEVVDDEGVGIDEVSEREIESVLREEPVDEPVGTASNLVAADDSSELEQEMAEQEPEQEPQQEPQQEPEQEPEQELEQEPKQGPEQAPEQDEGLRLSPDHMVELELESGHEDAERGSVASPAAAPVAADAALLTSPRLRGSPAVSRMGDAPPNIVWLMADDLGYGEVGLTFVGSESRRIDTPNLDKLALGGIFFRSAYSGYTVCAPSRTAFFTGRHVGQFTKHGYDGENIRPDQGAGTLAVLLKSAGYRTGAFGKISPLTDPVQTGFDRFVGQVDQNLCHNMYPTRIDEGSGKFNYKVGNNKRKPQRTACQDFPEDFNYTIDIFHREGVQWLKSVAGKGAPFFLYMSYTVPHAGGWDDVPLDSVGGQPSPSQLHYKDKPWPDVEKDHAAVVTLLDSKVGHLLQTLRDLGVERNTVVFFASDNGAHVEGGHMAQFFKSTGGLRGQKRSLYEGGVRSPSMVQWPAAIQAGRISDYAWAFWDVLPTLAELAGVKAPPDIDGVSIVPTLLGQQQPDKEYIYFSWRTRYASNGVPDDGPRVLLQTNSTVTNPARKKGWLSNLAVHRAWRRRPNVMAYSVRQGVWKGVVSVCEDLRPSLEDGMELFNLEKDPYERSDIANLRPDVVAKLKALVVSKNLTCQCFQCSWPAP